MATSGTATFTETRGDLIRSALIDIGAIGAQTAAIDPMLATEAAKRLDALIKSLDKRGCKLYQAVRQTFTTVGGQAAYVLPTNVLDVDKPARYTPSGSTTAIPLYPMEHTQWMITSDRTIQGQPVQYYIEKALDTNGLQFCTMYLYAVPQATGDTVEYRAFLKSQDSGTDASNQYVSQNWLHALRLGLAAACGPMVREAPGTTAARQAAFEAERDAQINADTEIADYQEVPFGSYFYGGNF